LWSYVSGIYNFLCSMCVVNSHPTHDEVYSIQHYFVIKFVSEICDRFSPGTCSTVSSTNKTDHHDITEILLKMALNTITLTLTHINIYIYFYIVIIIIWNRRGHECSLIWKLSANFTLIQCIKIVSIFLGLDMSGTIFLGSNLVSFNQTFVPY
jgi:hypothetical protein